jgi:pimeloyl-ACP methyl ester carboxylesterase
MSRVYIALVFIIFGSYIAKSQITPTTSPYYSDGTHMVITDSNLTDLNKPLLFYYPQTTGIYPVLMFQLGANGFGSSVINRHTYDLFMEHLASYGFVVIVIDDSQAGFPNGATFKAAHDWFKNKVIDPGHWLSSHANPNLIVIGGHSNGGVNASALLVDRPTEIDGIVFMDSYPSGGVIGIGAHDVSGYTGKVLTMSANENDPTANKDGWDKFTSSTCKTFIDIAGLGHGGFGDYVLASQPVGPIGRTDATATIRHFLVSWMLSEYQGDTQASNQLMTSSLQPNTVQEFVNDCGTLPTGITSVINEPQINIFPNPTNDNITITSQQGNTNISVINSIGKVVYFHESNTEKTTIDLHLLTNGIYIVRLTNQNFNYSKTIIKN